MTTTNHWEITATIQTPLGNNSNHPECTKKYQQPTSLCPKSPPKPPQNAKKNTKTTVFATRQNGLGWVFMTPLLRCARNCWCFCFGLGKGHCCMSALHCVFACLYNTVVFPPGHQCLTGWSFPCVQHEQRRHHSILVCIITGCWRCALVSAYSVLFYTEIKVR